MIVLGAVLVGAILGGLIARRRGGNRLDIAQYATAMAIALGLLGLFVTIFLARSMG